MSETEYSPLHDGSVMQDVIRRIRESREGRQSLTIHNGAPPTDLYDVLITRKGQGRWTDAALIPELERRARLEAKRRGDELVPTPDPIFDREEF